MSHSAPITRAHPTAFVLLVDRSGSMAERIVFEGREMTKADAVSQVASAFIDELLHRARRERGVGDYYDLAAIGYSGAGVLSLLSPRGEFALPSRLAAAEVRRERVVRERVLPSGRSVVAVAEHAVRIDAQAVGATPMCGALADGLRLVERWCAAPRNAGSYPPTIINITDGEASDGGADEVRELARRIRATGTADGHTILFNIHLARGGDTAAPVLFPRSLAELPDHRYARLLWDISSEMPAACRDMIRSLRGETVPRHGVTVPRGGAVYSPHGDTANGIRASDATGGFRAVGWGCHIGALAALMNIGSINSVMV